MVDCIDVCNRPLGFQLKVDQGIECCKKKLNGNWRFHGWPLSERIVKPSWPTDHPNKGLMLETLATVSFILRAVHDLDQLMVENPVFSTTFTVTPSKCPLQACVFDLLVEFQRNLTCHCSFYPMCLLGLHLILAVHRELCIIISAILQKHLPCW